MDSLLKFYLLCSLILSNYTISLTAQNYTGTVYIDNNSNGIYDHTEKGLSGICVTDGFNVTRTDINGNFCLSLNSKAKFIYITTPSGFMTLDNFYKPLKTRLDSYNFGLIPLNASRSGKHSFLHISDTEITQNTSRTWIDNLINYANNEDCAFIIHTGDICYNYGLNEHIKLLNSNNLNRPMYYCLGNHDLVKGKYGEELFESIYGPSYYSFNVDNTHYIVTPMLVGDVKPSFCSDDILNWLEKDISLVDKSMNIIIFNHNILTNSDQFEYTSNNKKIDLNKHNLKAWIYGHWHMNHIKKQGDVLTISTAAIDKGGIDHSTSAFRMLTVNKAGNIESELRYPNINNLCQIVSPQHNSKINIHNNQLKISVNTYHSNAKTKDVILTYSINNKLYKNTKLTKNSDWNWSSTIPANKISIGDIIKVNITTIFNDGTINSDSSLAIVSQKTEPINPTRINQNNWCNYSNYSHSNTINSSIISDSLNLNWVNNVQSNIFMSYPLIIENSIFIASIDENYRNKAGITCLDLFTGKINWIYKTTNSIKNNIASTNGLIFSQDVEGYLYAIDLKTGHLNWKKKLDVMPLPALVEGLNAEDGVVYAGSGNGLCAINADTGNYIWKNTSWKQAQGSTSTIAINKNKIILGTQWGALYCNDKNTGDLIWKIIDKDLRFRSSSPSFYDNLMYITSNEYLFLIDINNGSIILRKKTPYNLNTNSTPLITKNLIILSTANGGLIALDKQTLDIIWQYQIDSNLIFTSPYSTNNGKSIENSPILIGNKCYFGGSDGCLYGVDINTGKCFWKYKTGAPVYSSLSFASNMIISADFSGNVYNFSFK